MEDKPPFTQPTMDLFSTAVLAARGQTGKKPPAIGPTSGRIQGKQGGDELPSLMSLQLRGTGSAVGSQANDNMSKQNTTNVNMHVETSKPDDDGQDFELLKQKIFTARMMGAPATVVNDIVNSFHIKESNSSSLFSLGSQQGISSSPVQSQASTSSFTVQQQQQQTTSVGPAQQAQARMIAAALFNTIKPMLSTSATTTTTCLEQQQQQQQQLPAKLQETLAQIKLHQQQQQETKLPEERQEFETPLQKTLSLLKIAQLQKPAVTSQQQPSAEKITPFSAVGQTAPQRWSNRSPKTAVVHTGEATDTLGKLTSTSSSKWSTDTILTTLNLSTSNPQHTPMKSTADILNVSKHRDPRLSASVDRNVPNTAPSRPTLGTEPVVLSVVDPPKLNLLGKVPVSVGSPSIQTIEVLESLKNDGYIDSPPGIKPSGRIDLPKGKILDKNSTGWQGTSVVGNWKAPKPVPKPKELGLNKHAVTKTTSSAQAPMSSTNFQGVSLGPKQMSNITGPVNRSMDAWQDSVDAFLQVTNRAGDSKWKTAGSGGRKRLHETQPVAVPTARLLHPGAQVETPFLSETDTEETISIIDRRVEMLRMQKVQILQDQMEEFYREIQEFDKEIEDSQPASKKRKKKKSDQGPTSYDKDKDNYRQTEIEKYQERDGDKRRDRDKGGDDDRRRRNEKRSPSNSKRSLSRDRDDKRLRSPSYHREEPRKREGSRRSSASPKRAQSRSHEDTSKDSKTSKDAPMVMRQGRYPSKYGERRTSVSPERKRNKIDTKSETFREGRWQFASKVFDRKRGFRLGFGREKKKIEIRLKRSDPKKEDEKEKKDSSSKTTRKSSKAGDAKKTDLEPKKDKSDIKKSDEASSDSRRSSSNRHEESSETPKSGTGIKNSPSTDPVSTSSTNSSSVGGESTKTHASATKSDTILRSTSAPSIDSNNITNSTTILSTVVSSTAASNSSTTVQTSRSSALTNDARVSKSSTKSSKLSTDNSSTSASNSKPVAKISTASTNISTASTASSLESKSSMSSSKTAAGHSTFSARSSTMSAEASTSTKVLIPSTSKHSPNKPTLESSTTDKATKDSINEQKAKQKMTEVKLLTEADAALGDSSLTDEIKDSSISHQLGLLRQLQIDKHVADKVLVDWFCYVCGTICHTLKVYRVHIAGRKHKTIYEKLRGSTCRSGIKNKLISKLKMLPMKGADPMTIATMAGALRANLNSMSSETSDSPLTESTQSSQCGQCFRPYTCSYKEHLLSEEHKKFEKIRPRCNVCNMIFQKIVQYRKHLISPSHKKKAQAMIAGSGKVQKTSIESDLSSTNDKPGPKTRLIGSEFVIPISGFFCKLCSKFYNKEKTAKDVHCETSYHISKTKQYYASRNQSTGTSFKASLGIVNETKLPRAMKEAKTPSASIVVKTLKTVSTAPAVRKQVPTGRNVQMKRKSPDTCGSVKDSSEGKAVDAIPPRNAPAVENQTMSIPSRVSVRLSGRKTRSATTKTGSLITVTKSTDVPGFKASGETDMEAATTPTKKNTAKPDEEVRRGKTQLKEPNVETAVPVKIKPNPRGSQEIVSVVAQPPQTICKETKLDNINLKSSEEPQETKSKATPKKDMPKDALPKDIPPKKQAPEAETSKKSDGNETLPIASPKRVAPARVQTMRTRSNRVTPQEDLTNVKSNSSSLTGTSTSIEVSTKPLSPTGAISKEVPHKLTVLKDTMPKDVKLKGSSLQEALLKQVSTSETNPADPEVKPKETTSKAVPPKAEASLDVATNKTESRKASPKTKPESLPKGYVPKDLTFQKSLPKEAGSPKASTKTSSPGGATLNANPAKKILTKKPMEVSTKETKQQDAAVGNTAQERVAPGKAPVQEVVPKEAMPEARLAKVGIPKKDAGKIESPKESTTQNTTASKAVDFPQPTSASTPKHVTSSPRAAPSAASPLHLSSPKVVPHSPVNLQGAAVSKMATSSLTSPRRSGRSINAQKITTSSTSGSESESSVSILRREPQDQSRRVSSTASPIKDKTRTPDETNKSSLIKGTIQVTASPGSRGPQQPTTRTTNHPSSAKKETDVKTNPSSSMRSSTDSSNKKITAKEVEVAKTPTAEKGEQMKGNMDSSTQRSSSALPGSPSPSSNLRKASEVVSPSAKISSPPPNSIDPDPDIDSKDQEDFMNVEELMSGDVIVLDEDDGQDMSDSFENEDIYPEVKGIPSDHKDIFTDKFGNVDGLYVSEDQILKGEWIVEDTEGEVEEDPELNYEEPGFQEREFRDSNVEEPEFEEMDFGVPDFNNMLSLDEVGGSDDEDMIDEEVRDDDIDQVEWEVLSEAEGD